MTRPIHALYNFLTEAFTAPDLRRFFTLHYHDLVGWLPGESVSLADLAMKVTTALQKNGAIDEELFTLLERERPRLQDSVEQLRRQYLGPAGDPPPRPVARASSAAPVEPRRDEKRLHIVFVAANPIALPELQLSAEARRIEDKLRGTPAEQRVSFQWFWRAGPEDLLDLFFQSAPDILHFAGHGAENGALLLEAADGQAHPVPPEALADLIAARPRRPRVIVLNACFSAVMAKALVPLVDAVVGMRSAVDDAAARQFAVQFYRALAHGDSLQSAFDTARAALRVHNLPSEDLPQLSMRGGLDARQVHLL
jgi:hypothetical protein